jgi:hypothetical protein
VLGTFDVAISTASPGVLAVSPATGFVSSGTLGGPFTPNSITYTLTNSGGSAFNWTVSKTADWLSLSPTGGTLPVGATTNVVVSLNPSANTLPAGGYTDTVAFVNTSTGNGNTGRAVSLVVIPPAVVLTGSWLPACGFQVSFAGEPLQTYVMEVSGDLGNWASVVTNTASPEGVFLYLDATAAQSHQRFYRARLSP